MCVCVCVCMRVCDCRSDPFMCLPEDGAAVAVGDANAEYAEAYDEVEPLAPVGGMGTGLVVVVVSDAEAETEAEVGPGLVEVTGRVSIS